MNIKVFSIIVAILVVILLILGGTYYYLFEYPKTSTYNFQNYQNISQNSQTQQSQAYNQNIKQDEQISTKQEQQDSKPIFEEQTQNELLQEEFSQTQKQISNENNASKNIDDKKSSEQENFALTQKEQNSQTQDKIYKDSFKEQNQTKEEQKLSNKVNNKNTHKTKHVKLSPIKEYQQRGKDSRFEPELSSESIKVYVMDGKALSEYRINLLKDMLQPVQERSQDYNLSVFVQMLPKNEMNVTIYNKDIIFSDKKRAYKYIKIDQISPFFNRLDELNANVKREEIIERISFQSEENDKGSDFSKHIKSLKRGLATAQYFFPFCEIIEISSVKK